MHQSIKIISGAVLLSGLSLIAAGFAAAPSGPDALNMVSQDAAAPTASERIDAAFGVLAAAEANPAVLAAARSSQKGDLLVSAGCAGQYWPHIAPGCLVGAEAQANPPVRTVTIGYEIGETTSVLIRMPAQIASR